MRCSRTDAPERERGPRDRGGASERAHQRVEARRRDAAGAELRDEGAIGGVDDHRVEHVLVEVGEAQRRRRHAQRAHHLVGRALHRTSADQWRHGDHGRLGPAQCLPHARDREDRRDADQRLLGAMTMTLASSMAASTPGAGLRAARP